MRPSSTPITDWLALGPIYHPEHQNEPHSPQDGHPPAAEIIGNDLDNNPASFTHILQFLKTVSCCDR